jgi:hypothetical protein
MSNGVYAWWKRLGAWRPGQRHLLIHAHLYKNAGTTFDFSLQRSFGGGFVDHRDDAQMKRGAAYLGPYLAQHPDCHCLSSHWVTQPLPRLPRVRLHCCLLLRDPVERMLSVYRFERRQNADTPGSRRARELDFPHYMQWQMRSTPGPAVKNYQVRYCSGNFLGADIECMYDSALHWLSNVPLVGMVHRYDESMVLFEHRLRPYFPDLDLAYVTQNVSSAQDKRNLEQRRTAVLEELDSLPGLRDRVLQRNQYDIALFEAMVRQFDQALSAVPGLPERLTEFRQRSQALAAGSPA